MPDLLSQAADLPSFRVVPPRQDIRVEDFVLPDGTNMVKGGMVIPPARNFATIVNSASRVYSYRSDEAMRDNFVRARAMRRDAFLRGLHEERVLPTLNRKWHLKVPDDRDKTQVFVRESLKQLIESVPQFPQFKRALLDGVWFGKAGCQWGYNRDHENDHRWGIPAWDPLHGDSIQYTFDGVPAVLLDSMTTGWYSQHGATWGPTGDLRMTDRGGTALVLGRPYWRSRFAVYQHVREKADYFEGELAGSVQGLGIRGMVYWSYVVRTEALSWMLTYMQAVGMMDLLIFNYPAGNNEARLKQEANAAAIVGKAAIACPRNPAQNWPAVEQVKMNAEGLNALHSLLNDYMDRHIERLYVGQSMSSGADDSSGLGGSGRAAFSMMTKDEILSYDTTVLDETISRDMLGPLKAYNFPWARFPVKFVSVMPDLEKSQKVQDGLSLVQVGVEIKVDELREAAGYSRPEEGDETVGSPRPDPAAMGGVPGMPPAVPPDAAGGAIPAPPGQPAPPVPGPSAGPPGVGNGVSEFPTPFADGGGAPVAGPAMGYPGGGNTYLPRFRRPIGGAGFTRYDFREEDHPRDDGGRFVDKEAMNWAKTDPELAAELRSEVTRPEERAKLDRIIGAGPAVQAPPKPTYRVPPAPSPAHAAFAESLAAAVYATPGLDPRKAQARADAVRSVVHSMPAGALSRLSAGGFGGLESVASNKELNDLLVRDDPKMKNAGGRVAGFYRGRDGKVLMNGGNETHGIGEFDHARGTFAHELGHALDASPDRTYWDVSGDDEFLAAWEAEIARADAPLSKYATTNEVEGLAEFARLLWGSNVPRAQVAATFPRCYEFFRKRGLV